MKETNFKELTDEELKDVNGGMMYFKFGYVLTNPLPHECPECLEGFHLEDCKCVPD